jgi:hypothetical protein
MCKGYDSRLACTCLLRYRLHPSALPTFTTYGNITIVFFKTGTWTQCFYPDLESSHPSIFGKLLFFYSTCCSLIQFYCSGDKIKETELQRWTIPVQRRPLHIHKNKHKALKLYTYVKQTTWNDNKENVCKTIYTTIKIKTNMKEFRRRTPPFASSHDSWTNNHDHNEDIKNNF